MLAPRVTTKRQFSLRPECASKPGGGRQGTSARKGRADGERERERVVVIQTVVKQQQKLKKKCGVGGARSLRRAPQPDPPLHGGVRQTATGSQGVQSNPLNPPAGSWADAFGSMLSCIAWGQWSADQTRFFSDSHW